jgi:small subunit ribosomal protein S7
MRGKQAKKRVIKPDEIYKSEVVSKMINYVMYDGKKEVAREITYKSLEDLGARTKTDPVEALDKALNNVKPKVEVRSRRVGGANFQVPVQVNPSRQLALGFKWIIEAARNGRKSDEFWVSLSRELQNAYKNEGTAVKKKEEVHRMAEANKAFSQFA